MSLITYKKFNLPLPEKMHRALFAESRRAGIPATRLVRSVLERWIEQRQRENRRDEVREFATKYGGSELDLDPVLEDAAAEELSVLYEDEDEAG